MNRRSFIGTIALASASIFLPRAPDAFHWQQPKGKLLYVLNPEYVNAPYEVAGVAWNEPVDLIYGSFDLVRVPKHLFPFRYADAANVVSIPPFIQKRVLPHERHWTIAR